MRKKYDFSKGNPNPYARQLKQSITMRVDRSTLDYFKPLAAEFEVPSQTWGVSETSDTRHDNSARLDAASITT